MVVRQTAVPDFEPRRLRQLRKAANLTQEGLAARAGLPAGTIVQYENGHRAPRADNLAALAEALGVPPTDLTAAVEAPETLARLRINAGCLTQQAAAERAGLTRGYYAAIERGEIATVPDATIAKIADALGITPAQVKAAHAQALRQSNDDATSADTPDTLAKLRISSGLTQQGAAARAGLLRHHYAAIERGEIAAVSQATIAAIAATLGASAARVKAAHQQARGEFLRSRD